MKSNYSPRTLYALATDGNMNMNILEDAVAMGLLPKEFIENLKNRKCPTCGADVSKPEFRDELSLKEFTISGMCQKCQDAVFGGSDE